MTVQRNSKGHWLPGQSGNPGGAPRQVEVVRELARQRTAEAIETLTKIMHDETAPAAARVAAATSLLDRGWGRPQQSVDVQVGPSFAFHLPLDELSETEWLEQNTPKLPAN